MALPSALAIISLNMAGAVAHTLTVVTFILLTIYAGVADSKKLRKRDRIISRGSNDVDPHMFSNMLGKPQEPTHKCVEQFALQTCDLFCMCQIMVNRQVGLWSAILPPTDATQSDPEKQEDKYVADSTPKSQCDIWMKNEEIAGEECYAMCTIAEQYVVAAHGWDSKVCARAENEGKAYVLEAAKAGRL